MSQILKRICRIERTYNYVRNQLRDTNGGVKSLLFYKFTHLKKKLRFILLTLRQGSTLTLTRSLLESKIDPMESKKSQLNKNTCPIRQVESSFWCSNRLVEKLGHVETSRLYKRQKEKLLSECHWCNVSCLAKEDWAQNGWCNRQGEQHWDWKCYSPIWVRSFMFLILLGVPSIAFNQQHEPFPFWFLRTSDEVMPRSQESRPRTTNVTRKIRI